MRKLFLMFSFLLMGKVCLSQVAIQHLLTENLTNPIGIDAPSPRFSWQLTAGNMRSVMQSAYQVKVGTEITSAQSVKNIVWDSGKINSDQSVYIPYKGDALLTGQKYYWQVKVWDNYGKASNWSTLANFQVGMLVPTDWKAQWIIPGFDEDTIMRPSPVFRKAFPITKKIKQAVAFITAHGLYEAELNGRKIGDAYLTPGWTSYTKRLQYQAYDVTTLLQEGKNVVGATLGNGWYRGFIGTKPPTPGLYGKDIALLFQMEITYTDGTKTTILSDNSWKSSTAQVRFAEIYYGSTIDNRMQQKSWSTPNFDDKNWAGVKIGNFSKDVLVATINEPVKKHESFKPVKIFTTPKGEKVIDFGQNLVGWVRLKVKGNNGDKIVISHAEVLDKAGNFYTENLRTARSQDTFILKGDEEETFEPAFTFHGFRYIKIEGYKGEILPENFTAYALYSDMAPAGSFSCSNPLINQLQSNIQWGQKGNFLDVPTDCPQRDERMGWTGDAQVFSRTASYNMNVHAFFDKWLRDVSADQYITGSVPKVIPNIIVAKDGPGGSTGWADVTTIVPWDMYLAYGDKQLLENQYNSMKAWVKYMQDQSKNYLWQSGKHYGDWLFYSVNDDRDGTSAITSKY